MYVPTCTYGVTSQPVQPQPAQPAQPSQQYSSQPSPAARAIAVKLRSTEYGVPVPYKYKYKYKYPSGPSYLGTHPKQASTSLSDGRSESVQAFQVRSR
jgi:hypothetical protein